MGFFSEIKKLFFTVESVGKSTAKKGVDYAKEAGGDIADKAANIGKSAAGKAASLTRDITEKAEDLGRIAGQKAGEFKADLSEKVIEKTEDMRDAILHSTEGTMNMINKSETLKKVAETTEQIGGKILDAGEQVVKKGGEQVEKLGGFLLGENHENLEKAKQFTENVGANVLRAKDVIIEKAGESLDNLNNKIDDMITKGQEMDAHEAAKPRTTLQEKLDEHKSSMLDGKDDFFAKAEKFARGDYGAVQEGKMTIIEGQPTERAPDNRRASGFDDLDGDGNEIIDDAIIIED